MLQLFWEDGDFLLIEVAEAPGGLTVEFLNRAPAAHEEAKIKDYVAEWFDSSADLLPFYEMAKTDAVLAPLAQQYNGLRLIGVPDLFEALCWAIVGQQINLAFAFTLKRRLIVTFGRKFVYEDRPYYTFPKPGDFSTDSYETLLSLQFSKQKARYVLEIADAFRTGLISKGALQNLPYEEALLKLCAVKGVGNWTASYSLMKSLRRSEAFPVEDVGLHNAIKNQLKLEKKPTAAQVRAIALNWQNYYAYAVFYLWRSLLS